MMMTKYLLVFIRAARSRPTGEVPCLALAASRCQSSLRLVCLVPIFSMVCSMVCSSLCSTRILAPIRGLAKRTSWMSRNSALAKRAEWTSTQTKPTIMHVFKNAHHRRRLRRRRIMLHALCPRQISRRTLQHQGRRTAQTFATLRVMWPRTPNVLAVCLTTARALPCAPRKALHLRRSRSRSGSTLAKRRRQRRHHRDRHAQAHHHRDRGPGRCPHHRPPRR